MKIVAFLESPSEAVFPEGSNLELYQSDQEYHRKTLKESMTGRRLWQAFGNMYDEIWWDNVNPLREGVSQKHICNVVDTHKPELILTFGGVAGDALSDCVAAIRMKIMKCHHPNARFRTQGDLDEFGGKVREYILTQGRK